MAKVFARIYPDEIAVKDVKQQQTKLHNLCSDLTLAIEAFVAAARDKQDDVRRYSHCAEYALLKSNESLWKSAMRKWDSAIAKLGDSIEARHYRYLYLKMEFESPFFDRLHRSRAPKKWQEVIDAQQHFQWLTQLAFACGVLYRKEVTENTGTAPVQQAKILRQLLKATAPLSGPACPVLHLYREVILLKQKAGDMKQIRAVFGLIQRYKSKINATELNDLIRFLLNYCTLQSNTRSEESFLEIRLEVERWAIRHGLLMQQGLIPPEVFLNACTNAASLKQFKLVDEYIANYASKLEKKKRDFLIGMARAGKYFHQQEFVLAESELARISIQNYTFSTLRHLLQIRIVYHLFLTDINGKANDMRLTLDAFQQFFRRNNYKQPLKRIKGYLNLEALVSKIVEYLANPNKHNSRQLSRIQKAAAIRPLALTKWAQQIVSDLL